MSVISTPAWLTRLLIRDGPLCHLCGLCVDVTGKGNQRLSASRDHLIPNPHVKGKHGAYRKRLFRDPDHELNQPDNILLSHKWCNSARGSLEVTADVKASICARISALYPPDKFTALLKEYENWCSRTLNPEIKPLNPHLKGRQRAKFIADQRMRLEWKAELEQALSAKKENNVAA